MVTSEENNTLNIMGLVTKKQSMLQPSVSTLFPMAYFNQNLTRALGPVITSFYCLRVSSSSIRATPKFEHRIALCVVQK